jgi:hypothetical protein
MFSCKIAFELSEDDMIELRDPEIYVKTITPKISKIMQKILSPVVEADISPKPTVVIVVTVK